jgi:hypothetical protein
VWEEECVEDCVWRSVGGGGACIPYLVHILSIAQSINSTLSIDCTHATHAAHAAPGPR